MNDKKTDELESATSFHLAKLHGINVYNNVLDEMDYLNLLNSLKYIKDALLDKTIKIDDVNIWLKNNDKRIKHILEKYKSSTSISHQFY